MNEPDQRPAIVPEPLPPLTSLSLIDKALEKGVSGEQLALFIDGIERLEKQRASIAYGAALAEFQRKCPPIERSRAIKTKSGDIMVSGLDLILAVAGPIMADCGISPSWEIDNAEAGMVSGSIRIRVGAFCEDRKFVKVPVPSINLSSTQAYGAAIAYFRAYTLKAALNIVEAKECQESMMAESETVPPNEEECAELAALLREKAINRDRFFKWASSAAKRPITTLEELPRELFDRAMANYGGSK